MQVKLPSLYFSHPASQVISIFSSIGSVTDVVVGDVVTALMGVSAADAVMLAMKTKAIKLFLTIIIIFLCRFTTELKQNRRGIDEAFRGGVNINSFYIYILYLELNWHAVGEHGTRCYSQIGFLQLILLV